MSQTRHLFLFGEYELTVDEKNRLLIPSEVRRQLDPERDGDGFYLVVGVNEKIWLYPEHYYEELVSRRPQEIAPANESLDFEQRMFALASRIDWDKQGRVLLPDKIIRRKELNREITMIGVRDHLELWNRDAWEDRRLYLESKR